jgi:hypothetical protein
MENHVVLEYKSPFGDKIRLVTNADIVDGTFIYSLTNLKRWKLEICGRNYNTYSAYRIENIDKYKGQYEKQKLEARMRYLFFKAVDILNENKKPTN